MVTSDLHRVASEGGGEPPYLWNVLIVKRAKKDAEKTLSEIESEHIKDQIRELARSKDPARPATLSVESIGDFYELREKGGPLGKKNVRVYFSIVGTKSIVILGVYKKEEDGKTPPYMVELMSTRLRKVPAAVAETTAKVRR